MSELLESYISVVRRLNRIMCICVLIVATILGSATSLWAASTIPSDAREVVTGWLRTDTDPLGARLGQAVDHVETFTDETNQPLYYVVYLQPQGFVIVSADDLIEPIIGFSPSGIYDPTSTRPLGALVTTDLENRFAKIRTVPPSPTSNDREHLTTAIPNRTPTQRKWDLLKGSVGQNRSSRQVKAIDRTEDIEDLRVWPLLQLDPNDETTWIDWGQRGYAVYRYDETEEKWSYTERLSCFNYYTPPADPYNPATVGNGDNYPTGCVGTALALLLRYHQWPKIEPDWIDPITGQAKTFPIKVTTDEVSVSHQAQLLGGSGEYGAYNWDNMPARPLVQGLQEAHCQEIGALCYDAGITLRMSYSDTGSGAWVENMKGPLVNVFRYANAIIGMNDHRDITASLDDMVNPNLDSGHPVVFSIRAEQNSVGHAVVCDGYGYHHATLYHHLNTGWVDTILLDDENGVLNPYTLTSDDVWYALPDVNDMNQVSVDFDLIRVCVYNVFPEASGEIISGRVLNDLGKPAGGETVLLEHSEQLVDTCRTNPNGIYAFVGCDPETLYTVSVPGQGYPDQRVRTGTSRDYTAQSGNRWGVDFPTSVPARDVAGIDNPQSSD